MSKAPRPEKEMITTEELAERWGMTRDHMEVKRMRGEGPPWIKLGDGSTAPVRYRMVDVLAYEQAHQRTSTKKAREKGVASTVHNVAVAFAKKPEPRKR